MPYPSILLSELILLLNPPGCFSLLVLPFSQLSCSSFSQEPNEASSSSLHSALLHCKIPYYSKHSWLPQDKRSSERLERPLVKNDQEARRWHVPDRAEDAAHWLISSSTSTFKPQQDALLKVYGTSFARTHMVRAFPGPSNPQDLTVLTVLNSQIWPWNNYEHGEQSSGWVSATQRDHSLSSEW